MDKNKQKRNTSLIWLYMLSGVVISGLLVWSSLRILQETPFREVSVEIPGEGWVTVRFGSSPFPLVSAENVMVHFIPINTRGVFVDLGMTLPFTFGQQGDETAIGSGQANFDSTETSYIAIVEFPAAGAYWLELDLGAGQMVVFQFNVR